jgi:hypothetical protein
MLSPFLVPSGGALITVTQKSDTSVWNCDHNLAFCQSFSPVARHSAERISSSTMLFVVGAVLALVGLDSGISNLISKFVLELPNTRKQELEGQRTLITLNFVSLYENL